MHAAAVLGLAAFAGCRLGFDAVDGDARPVDAEQPPAQLLVVPVIGTPRLHDVAFDPQGNLAVVGELEGTGSFAGKPMTTTASAWDMFVGVADPTGAPTRVWTGGTTQLGSLQNVAWLPDGSLAASGYFSGTLTGGGGLVAGSRQAVLALRFDPAGALAFARHYQSTTNIQARGLAAAADRLGVVGIYNSTVDFGDGPLPVTGNDNGFVVRMDASGGNVRSRAFVGSNDIFINDIVFAPDGDIYISGRLNATSDFGLGPVSPAPGGSSGVVARYASDLTPRWVRTFGNATVAQNLELLSNGDVIAVGEVGGTIMIDGITMTSMGSTDGWIGRFAAVDGTVAWMRTLEGPGREAVQFVAVNDDRIFIAGDYNATTRLAGAVTLACDGADDVVIAELELDGQLAWNTQLGGTGDVELGLGGMSIDPTGQLAAFAVSYDGELKVAGQVLTGSPLHGAAVALPIER